MKRTFALSIFLCILISFTSYAQRVTATLTLEDSLTLRNTIGEPDGSWIPVNPGEKSLGYN